MLPKMVECAPVWREVFDLETSNSLDILFLDDGELEQIIKAP